MILTKFYKILYKNIKIIYKNGWERLLNLSSKKSSVILNRAKDYYENDKERLREQAKNKYRNLSEK